MSNGSITELISKGELDKELTDINNNTSLFNYSITKKNKYSKAESRYYPKGKANWGNTVRFNLEKDGDLLYGLYLVVKLPKLSVSELNVNPIQDENDPSSIYRVRYTDFIGNVLVEKISLYINGQLIDEQYGDYMQYYTDLYISDWNRKEMIGMDDNLRKPNLKINSEIIYIPFKFWFCNQTPLPVIALQYSDIYIDVKFRKFSECITILEYNNNNLYHSTKIHNEVPLEDVVLQANYYLTELNERKELAMKDYEILITQCQLKSTNFNTTANLEISFNHVVKDLMFLVQSNKHKANGEYFNVSAKMDYPPAELNPLNKYQLWDLEPQRHILSRARIIFDGIERLEWRDAKYFYNMQNHENYKNSLESYVYVYSFNINPTRDTNFSGCNFSRIDNPYLQVEVKPNNFILDTNLRYPTNDSYELKCFATNFNILVIKNGLAGLKYNN